MKKHRPAALVIGAALAAAVAPCSAGQGLTVVGMEGKETAISSSEIKQLPHTLVRTTDPHSKAAAEYRGVPLAEVLKRAGAPLGKELRGRALAGYVLVEAADGYKVVFSLAELDPEMAEATVLLADELAGAPLPPEIGPYRLVVPNDKKAARWVRQVTRLTVKNGAP